MNKGKRYDKKPKLNMKKVFGVFVALIVFIMIIVSIVKVIKNSSKKENVTAYNYYLAYQNQKYGVINNEGKFVVSPEYLEMIAIPNKSVAVFICTYNINDLNGTYSTKAIDQNGKELFTEYNKVEAIDNFDSKQNIWYEENVLRVFKDEKYGLINLEGKQLLPCEYDEITALKGTKANFLIKKDGKVGLVNDLGQTIINKEYSNIISLKENYKNEYIIVNENNQCGIINTSGTVLIEPKYEEVKYLDSQDMFAVKEEGIWKLADKSGQILIDGGFDSFSQAKGDNVVVIKNGKYGVVTKSGEEKIAPTYEYLKYTSSIYFIAKKDGKYGVITSENQETIPFEYIGMNYVQAGEFVEADREDYQTTVFDKNMVEKFTGIISEINQEKGYIKVFLQGEYKYYNFQFEEKNAVDLLTANTLYLSKKEGKYGFVNKSGKVIVEYQYEDATEQNSCGYAAVKKDGVWGSINKAGVEELKPSINLDNSIYTNFIANWHLNDSGLYYEK